MYKCLELDVSDRIQYPLIPRNQNETDIEKVSFEHNSISIIFHYTTLN
jgi:hypothetical protein